MTCLICGRYVPDGTHVCPECLKDFQNNTNKETPGSLKDKDERESESNINGKL